MPKYSIFSVIGLEMEYMIVNRDTLQVSPSSDFLLKALHGTLENEVFDGEIGVSNEFVMHLIELKNKNPVPPSELIDAPFEATLQKLSHLLAKQNLCLLPTGAHPFMDPFSETRFWPYDNHEIYDTYHRIFNSKGHGFSNLQSMHINLPFNGDEEFRRLHTLIRLLLPLLPAIGASTPYLDGHYTGMLDTRLDFYGKNQARIPEIAGDIIPEWVSCEASYQKDILMPMYQAIAPFDKEGILQYEWLNSRAAIPKFEYGAIEIRILDAQECVKAHLAIAKTILAILKNWDSRGHDASENTISTKSLKALYDKTRISGFDVVVEDQSLLQAFQLLPKKWTVKAIWEGLFEKVTDDLQKEDKLTMELILKEGNLSTRMLKKAGTSPDRKGLVELYQALQGCLEKNTLFIP